MRVLEGPLPYIEAAQREEAWRLAHLEAGCELLNAVPCTDGRHEGDPVWTRESALAEVRALVRRLGVAGRYPTRRQFAEGGLSGLDSAIERRLGGHRAVAAELGLAMPTPEWTRSSAEVAVRELVAALGLTRYPTPKEFEGASQSGLFQAITTRFGGHKAFARSLGLKSPRIDWTSELVDEAIRAVAAAVGFSGRYPTEREMRRHGPKGLAETSRRFGGNRARAARLGFRMSRKQWDPDSAAAAVLELVTAQRLHAYPTRRKFCEAGLSGLYTAIDEHLGGHDAMASQLRLARDKRRSRR